MNSANPWVAVHQALLDETARNFDRLTNLPDLIEKARNVKKLSLIHI